MTLLLTGFEQFGDFSTNPSWDALVVARERGLLPPATRLVQIPVVYDTAYATILGDIKHKTPAAVVCFGLHGGLSDRDSETIYIETTARNRDGAAKPDNAGFIANAEIVNGAAETLRASFLAHDLVESLQSSGFRAELSDDAGAYLCNHLFYRLVHGYGMRFPCGFVHVPPVKDDGGTLALNSLADAVGIIAGVMADGQHK